MLQQLDLIDTPNPKPRDIVQPLTGFIQADEFTDVGIDLRRFLMGENHAATFVMRLDDSDGMTGAGIFAHDHLVVDRSVTPRAGNLVVILTSEGFALARMLKGHGNRTYFVTERLVNVERTLCKDPVESVIGTVRRAIRCTV